MKRKNWLNTGRRNTVNENIDRHKYPYRFLCRKTGSLPKCCRKIMAACAERRIDGCIAAHSVTNAFYILRKELSAEARRNTLKDLCKIIAVIGIDSKKLISALANDKFDDIEDCLQMECAKDFSADYIVTRNLKDFRNSEVPAILPNEFLQMLNDK